MASTEPTPLQRFAGYCDRLSGLWKSIDVRAGVIKLRGEDAVLHAVVRLDPRPANEIEPPSHSPTVVGYYEARWESHPIEDLPQILRDLEQGQLTVKGAVMRVAARKEDSLGPTWFAGLVSHGGRSGAYPYARGNSVYVAASGGTVADLCGSAFETELQHGWLSLDQPFLDEVDVLRSYFELDVERRDRDAVLLHCLAPIPIEFGVSFYRGAPTVQVRAGPTVKPDDLRVGIVADGDKHRSTVVCSALEPAEGADGWRSFTVTCPEPSARDARFLLQYRGVHLDRRRVRNPAWSSTNPAFHVHEYLDPDRRAFRKALYGDDGPAKSSQNFEAGVAWLLGLCGLAPMVYAKTGVREEIDLVTHVPEEGLFVCVECTLGGPSKEDKLNKLYKRSREIAERVPDYDVLAVLATPWSGAEHLTDEDKGSLREKGVALLARENLEKLEEMAMNHASRGKVIEYLRDCIPGEENPLKGMLRGSF